MRRTLPPGLPVQWLWAGLLLTAPALANTQARPPIAAGTAPSSEPQSPVLFVPDALPNAEPEPATPPPIAPAPSDGELALFQLEEQLSQYATKIITASRSEEQSGESPAVVTVLTYQEIRRLGATTMEELLNFVPGFQVTRDVEQGNAFRIGVRGRSKFNSEYVLVLLNGQRLNDIYTGGITLLNRYITVDNIKQIEVIRGPGSALYGSGAFQGVINIVTFTQDENAVALHYGTQSSHTVRMSLSQELGPVALYAFARYYADEGFQYRGVRDLYGQEGDTRDPVRTFDFLGSLRWKGLAVHIRHSERAEEDFLTFGTLQQNSSSELQRQTSIGASFEHQLHRKVHLGLSAGVLFDRWRGISTTIPEGTELSPGMPFPRTQRIGPLLDSFQISLAATVRINPIQSNELIIGTSYDHLNVTDVVYLTNQSPLTGQFTPNIGEYRGELSFNDPHQRNIGSLFVQDRQRIGRWLQLTGGLRLDYYDDVGLAVSPRAAVVATTPIKSSFKLIYGKAFRAPSFLESYDKNNPVDFGNPALRPEDIHTIEVSASQDHRYFYVSANYYHNITLNIIDYAPPRADPQNPYNAPTFANSDDTTSTDGIEVDLSVKPLQRATHQLFLRGTLSHLIRAVDAPMPSLFGSFQVNYKVWKLMFDLNGVVRQGFARLPEQPTYVILNAHVTFDVTARIKLQLLAKNLLNDQYRTLTLPLGTSGVPNRGFTFQGGLILRL